MKQLVTLMLLSVLFAGECMSQDNTVETVTSAEEQIDEEKFSKLLAAYNKVIRVDQEELTLIKIDLIGPYLYAISNWEEKDKARNNVVNVSYERKWRPEWSWVVGSVLNADRVKVREARFYGGARYYYNMKRRILKGRSANNFSANYFGVLYYHQTRPGENDQHVSIDLLYGIQRRIGKHGFVDFDIGLENIVNAYSDREVGTDFKATVRLGWAIGS